MDQETREAIDKLTKSVEDLRTKFLGEAAMLRAFLTTHFLLNPKDLGTFETQVKGTIDALRDTEKHPGGPEENTPENLKELADISQSLEVTFNVFLKVHGAIAEVLSRDKENEI
jgi:hypothetical protein